MSQQKYTLFVALPLAEGGNVVVDVDQISCLFDGKPRADESAKSWLYLNDDRRFEVDGAAKDLLESITQQRADQIEALMYAAVAGAQAAS